VASDKLELELTETVLIEATGENSDVIDYRVDHIKIAQEFVSDIHSDSGDLAIVRAAISLARELGIKSLRKVWIPIKLLVEAGCKYIQVVPATRAAELLRQGVLDPARAEPEKPHAPPADARLNEKSQ
jgi:hypothetical protein